MSKATASSTPTARATAAAPHAPAAGPDSSVCTGSRAATVAAKVPPPDRITSTPGAASSAAAASSRRSSEAR